VKSWQFGAIVACAVLLASGSVAAVVLFVVDRADDQQAAADAKLLHEQIEACERGNVLRLRMSTAIVVLREFTEAAAKTRLEASKDANATRSESIRDAQAASRYTTLGGLLEDVKQVPCAQVINPLEGR
jgi:hypothetical protein